ncbi:NmrA family transcriptional regulator [Streptosporangium carneum]|uniref:NmrA family transcriptional regulator n=1 Tax=Streptosporangium carneum TaxID=47481 RepID=A0A9W6I8E0_9ACTN|nr:NmrA family transcriptional regulator [Streptosporangium carneum]GLK13980.1 NmrA family transcriptional regulator [Streptosporangium carneum]
MTTDKHTLVIGGTGKTGRRIVTRLRALGHHVRPASRTTPTPFDWENPATWDTALHGAHAIYLTPHPYNLNPAPQITNLLSRTTARVVLLSARDVPDDFGAEKAVKATTDDWTILRPTWFNQNFSEDYFKDSITAGNLTLPAGHGLQPFIDADDIADVAVTALTTDGHTGRTYDLSGPELLTFADAVTHISTATARPITYTPVPAADYLTTLTAAGINHDYATLITGLLHRIAEGGDAYLSDGVQHVLGRPARTFADYVATTWPQKTP